MNQAILEQLEQSIQQENIEKVVDWIIILAFKEGVSDIHIEPYETYVRLRFRIDGMLRKVLNYNTRIHGAVVSRIKISSGLKIDEKRLPQDGRIPFIGIDHENNEIRTDLRVSTLPTVTGEKVVMRIAPKAEEVPEYQKLGFQGNNLEFMNDIIQNPNGVVVVAGPTGSGKTVTLYSTLKKLNKEGINIMTIEDPCELEMEGLSQCQTNSSIGLTFSMGLRAALRQDPDIIMIGEVRDEETTEVAMHAALTGHFVLSTIHTNSAAETVTRFENMGIPKYIIASALRGVIAQRLARKVCDNCKRPIKIDKDTFEDMKETIQSIHPSENIPQELLNDIKIYQGKGCKKCSGTGYKGRIGIFEIMLIKGPLIDDILIGKNTRELEKAAVKQGMLTLKQDATLKALKGLTTMEEVYRVTNSEA